MSEEKPQEKKIKPNYSQSKTIKPKTCFLKAAKEGILCKTWNKTPTKH